IAAGHDGEVQRLPGEPPRFALERLRAGRGKLIGLVFASPADYTLFGPTLACGASGRGRDAAGAEVWAVGAEMTLPVVPRGASLTVGQVAAEGALIAGSSITYLVTVRNTGDQALRDLALTSVAPGGLTFTGAQFGAQVAQLGANPPTFLIADLPVHGAETLALSFAVGIGGGAPASPVAHRLSATALDEGGREVAAESLLELPLSVPPSGLQLFKTSMQGGVVPGGTVTYLWTLVNTGAQEICDIVVTDPLAAGLTFHTASLAADMHVAGLDPLVVEAGCLAAGATKMASVTCRLAADPALLGAQVANTARAAGVDRAGRQVESPEATCVLPVEQRPEGLDVEKVATANRITPGRPATYLVTVTNTGEQTLYDIDVTDTPPAGLTLSRAEHDNDVARIAIDPPVFRVPSLGPGESTMLSLIFEVSNNHFLIDDPVINVAAARGTTAGGQPVTAEADSSLLPMLNWQKGIDVEKIPVQSPLEAGGIAHYIITVTNTNVTPLTGVHLRDILDASDQILPPLTYIDSEPQGTWFPPNEVRWDLPDLMPGQSHTVILTVGVPIELNNTEADNNAWVRATTIDGVVVTDGDACSTPCRAKHSRIHLDKRAIDPRMPMGGQVGYHLMVTNDGGQLLRRVTLRDPVPAGLSLLTADYDKQRWRLSSTHPVVQFDMIGSLEPTQTEALTLFFDCSRSWSDYNLAVGDSTVVNAAGVVGQDRLLRWVEDADEAALGLLSPRPAIRLHYAHTTGEIVPGGRATYLVKFENIGDQLLSDVLLQVPDLAPQGLAFESSNYDAGRIAEDHVPGFHRWRLLGTLAKRDSEQLRLTYRAAADVTLLADPVAGTATVAALDEEQYPLGDSAAEAVPVSPKRGALTLDNTAAQGEIYPGETVTYILTVQAGSELDLVDLVVTAEDLLASGLVVVGTNYDANVFDHPDDLTWTAQDTIRAGTQEQIRITYRADDDVAALPAIVTMTAAATARDTYGRPLSDEDDEALAVLLPESHLLLEKVALASALVPGEALSYWITATNNGNQRLSGLVIVDPLPAPLTTFASYHDPARASFDPDPRTPRWTLLEDLEPGQAFSVRLEVTSDPDPSLYGDTITDVAEATAVDEGGETLTAQASDTLPVHTPDIAVDIAKVPSQNVVVPGGTLAYTLLVRNVGRVDLTETIVTEEVPAGLAYSAAHFDPALVSLTASAPAVVWRVGLLKPGRAAEIQVFFDVAENPAALANPLINTVTAEASGPGNQSAADLATASLPVQVSSAAIYISKRATDAVARPGEMLRFVIEVTNTGNLPLSGVVITDPLTRGLSYEHSIYDPDLVELTGLPPELSWELVGALAPGQRRTIDLIAYVAAHPDSLADPFCNSAQVTAVAPGGATVSDEAIECLTVQL
ncbi:MAG: DUF11 domain-containing protein, partial [Candidatus Eisenbacteria bacterium]|nr:DUF11 domain-containing protein [Candidatus Eisenbacteria bacterium]